MTFLNLMLLGGVAAASIPLIIHLFHRSRFKVIQWAAMHLLQPLQRTQRRRIRIEQLLLLLVRCAIPAALALCMARPVLTGMKALLGAGKSSVVVLLDNSYSMEVGGSQSAFNDARTTASKLVGQLGRGSEVAAIQMGGVPWTLTDEPSFNIEKMARDLGALEAGFGAAAVPASLEMAIGTLGKMREAQRELILISDFQKISWPKKEDAERLRLAKLAGELPMKPGITFIRQGREDQNNVCVQSLEFSRILLGVGQKFQVRARIQNHGDTPYPALRVFFRVDGVEKAAVQCALAAREAGQALFTHTFETPGSHQIAVEAGVTDPLKSDNMLLASVPVCDLLPVLLVNGKPSREPLEGETDFLEIALRPFTSGRGGLADLIATRTVTPDKLDAAVLKDQRVVVLANVDRLEDQRLKALEDFVRGGGGLLVFAGSKLDAGWYNGRFAADGSGLMPCPLGPVEGGLEDDAQHTAILSQHFEHPALQLFNESRNGDLSRATVRMWQRLQERSTNTFVFARLSSGDPFLAEKKFGEGTVILCAASCAPEWSNLPVQPCYLPLMQQLVTYLAAKFDPPRNVDVGRPLVAALPSALAGQTLQMADPTGAKHPVKVEEKVGRALLHYDNTRRPGLYVLDLPDKTPVHFVVNASRTESDLARLSLEEVKEAAKPFDATVVESLEEYRKLEQRRRFGREFWKPLLFGLLGLLFVEMFLQQRVRRRTP